MTCFFQVESRQSGGTPGTPKMQPKVQGGGASGTPKQGGASGKSEPQPLPIKTTSPAIVQVSPENWSSARRGKHFGVCSAYPE